MNSNTCLSELQADIKHYWPENHIIYIEGLIKGSGTFNTFCVAQFFPHCKFLKIQLPTQEGDATCAHSLESSKGNISKSSTTPGFLSQQLTDDFWLDCSYTRYGSHSSTAAMIL